MHTIPWGGGGDKNGLEDSSDLKIRPFSETEKFCRYKIIILFEIKSETATFEILSDI